MRDFNSPEYKRSRASYMAQCTVEYFVALLVADAFLAKVLTSIGISDALIGIISSFTTLAFVIQLLSIFLVRLKVSTKKLVMTFDTMSIFFFMSLYFIPFLPVGKTEKTILVMLAIMLAYAGKYLIYSICFKWANDFVEPTKRGIYSARKEIISLVTGIIFTMTMGYIIDHYESIGNLNGGFLFIATTILILNIANFVCLLLIKKEEEQEDHSITLKEAAKNTLGNKNFRNVVILTVLYDVTRYVTAGFLGVFKTNSLLMSVFLVQVVNMIGNFSRVLVSVPMGKYSDRTSFAKGFRVALCIMALGYLVLGFTTNKTWWLIIVYSILTNCSVAGTNANSFNITYSYVEPKYISQAMAIKNCIGGICGFGASIVGGRILQAVQNNGNKVLGIPMYGQQLLALISCVLCVITIIFLKNVIEKQEVVKR